MKLHIVRVNQRLKTTLKKNARSEKKDSKTWQLSRQQIISQQVYLKQNFSRFKKKVLVKIELRTYAVQGIFVIPRLSWLGTQKKLNSIWTKIQVILIKKSCYSENNLYCSLITRLLIANVKNLFLKNEKRLLTQIFLIGLVFWRKRLNPKSLLKLKDDKLLSVFLIYTSVQLSVLLRTFFVFYPNSQIELFIKSVLSLEISQ